MPDDTSLILGLPYIQPSQAQKHVTHNEAMRVLDVLVQLTVESRSLTTPPALAVPADRFIIPDGALDAWSGHTNAVAVWEGSTWAFYPARVGLRAFVRDQAELVTFDGTGWVSSSERPQQFPSVGINAVADEANRLSLSSPATLLNHDGGGHQVKVNKAAALDTASLLFQTGFSGRAEMGTAGNDDFSIKVSADGTIWTTALGIGAATGRLAAPVGLDAGSLTQAGMAVYGQDNSLGTVSQISGVPSGALIERGTNANGHYVRFADGTQICVGPDFMDVAVTTAVGAIFRSGAALNWTFPAAFGGAASTIAGNAMASPNSSTHWCSARVVSVTSMELSIFAALSQTGRRVRPYAIGRWF